jgi:2',3'-cyclic-nucleotide 2'-phosphodiesterase (5'-nucleotidase family)
MEKGTINGVPVVMAGSWGSHLGVIDLKISKEKGKWEVKNSESELRAFMIKQRKKA